VNAIFGQYGNSGTVDVSQFSRTGTATTNPDLFAVILAQSQNTSFSNILFGDSEDAYNSIFGSNSSSSGFDTSDTSLFGGVGSNLPAELSGVGGANTAYNNNPAYIELIARSNLVGKTVTYYDPSNTKDTKSGTVNSVSVDNGILQINVSGTAITPEYLKSVTE